MDPTISMTIIIGSTVAIVVGAVFAIWGKSIFKNRDSE